MPDDDRVSTTNAFVETLYDLDERLEQVKAKHLFRWFIDSIASAQEKYSIALRKEGN